MKENGNEPKLGRPPKLDRSEIILNNGFSRRQWEWYRKEASRKGMDTMALVRVAVQWYMDSVEMSREGFIVAEDHFEMLIKSGSESKKNKKKKKE